MFCSGARMTISWASAPQATTPARALPADSAVTHVFGPRVHGQPNSLERVAT
jgi:hypothetical protein